MLPISALRTLVGGYEHCIHIDFGIGLCDRAQLAAKRACFAGLREGSGLARRVDLASCGLMLNPRRAADANATGIP